MALPPLASTTMLSSSGSHGFNGGLSRYNSVSQGDLPMLIGAGEHGTWTNPMLMSSRHGGISRPKFMSRRQSTSTSESSKPTTMSKTSLDMMELSTWDKERVSYGRSLECRVMGAYYKHLARFKVPRTESWLDFNTQTPPQGRANVLKPLKIVPPLSKADKPKWIYGNPWSMPDKKLRRSYKSSDGLNFVEERISVIKTPLSRSKSTTQVRGRSVWNLDTPSTSGGSEDLTRRNLTMSSRARMVPLSPLPSLSMRKTLIQGRGSRMIDDDEDSDDLQMSLANLPLKRLSSLCVPATKTNENNCEVMTFHHDQVEEDDEDPNDDDEGVDVSGVGPDALRLSSVSLSQDDSRPRSALPQRAMDPFALSDDEEIGDDDARDVLENLCLDALNESQAENTLSKPPPVEETLELTEGQADLDNDSSMDDDEARVVLEEAFLTFLNEEEQRPTTPLEPHRQVSKSPDKKRHALADRARERAKTKVPTQQPKTKDVLLPTKTPPALRMAHFLPKKRATVRFSHIHVMPDQEVLPAPQIPSNTRRSRAKRQFPNGKAKLRQPKVIPNRQPMMPNPNGEDDDPMDSDEARDVLETAFLMMLDDEVKVEQPLPKAQSVSVRLFTDFSDSMSNEILKSVKQELRRRQLIIIHGQDEDPENVIEQGIDSFDQVVDDLLTKMTKVKTDGASSTVSSSVRTSISDGPTSANSKFEFLNENGDVSEGEDGRIPLHYTACNPKAGELHSLLVNSGSDPNSEDNKGKIVQYYMEHKDEISIPDWNPKPILVPPPSPKKSISLKAGAGMERAAMSLKAKREDRESKEAVERKLSSPEKKPHPKPAAIEGMEINATNIRIWIHEKDIGNLERVVWEGFGHLLVGQTSSHAKIRKFLDVVPKLMNEIKDVHTAAVYGDINGIASNEYRQPIYTSKDINGIPAFHKAVGNGHKEVAEHFMEKTDRSVLNLTDRHGRYALHYAAGIAAEDDKAMYNWLIEYGAEDHKADELLKVPMYYIDHPNKIKYSNCSLIPDAPRQSSPKKESRSGSSPEKSPVKSKSRSLSQAKRRSAETDKENHPVNRASKTNQGIPEWNLITKEHLKDTLNLLNPDLSGVLLRLRHDWVTGWRKSGLQAGIALGQM
eukprot:maker-scaffold18_size714446-snap-gene-5.16 protein:Tk08483 transcript:maker-scaffold18_size714446-snap-gene-5.16-mRNA-1 annotation:"hypothetical protein X777_10637"